MNNNILDNMGLMTSAYNPAPIRAAMMAILPPIIWIVKLRYAMNLNSFFLNNNALGTILADAKNKFNDSSWHIVNNVLLL